MKRQKSLRRWLTLLLRGDAYELFFDLKVAPERGNRDCSGSAGINVHIWNVPPSFANVYRQSKVIKKTAS